MATLVIRQARQEDCPALYALVQELAIYEREPEAVTQTLADFTALGFGPAAIWQALVAEREGVIVGMSLWYWRFSTWKGKELYLEDLIVTEAYRKEGIGLALFEATIKVAEEAGAVAMRWQVLDWNEPAIQFYKKMGAEIDTQWWNGRLAIVPKPSDSSE